MERTGGAVSAKRLAPVRWTVWFGFLFLFSNGQRTVVIIAQHTVGRVEREIERLILVRSTDWLEASLCDGIAVCIILWGDPQKLRQL